MHDNCNIIFTTSSRSVMKVRNGAGLVTMSSSSGIILDSSPPVPGVVFDGPPPPNGVLDVEYWSDVRGLSAHWSTFSEPQSTLTGYWWAIGSCHGCTDTQPFIPVGLKRSKHKNYRTSYTSLTARVLQGALAGGSYRILQGAELECFLGIYFVELYDGGGCRGELQEGAVGSFRRGAVGGASRLK